MIGLKENVIVGRLIPAGTGSMMKEYHRIAQERDAQTELEQKSAQNTSVNDPIADSLDQNDDSMENAS